MRIEELLIDLSDRDAKRRLLAHIGAMQNRWEIILKPWRPRRGNQANRFWFGVIVKSFQQYMSEQGQELTATQAHEFLKMQVLPVDVVNPVTGEVTVIGGESSKLDTEQFSAMVERGIVWLADLGIQLPEFELEAT